MEILVGDPTGIDVIPSIQFILGKGVSGRHTDTPGVWIIEIFDGILEDLEKLHANNINCRMI